jgi:hypothetical protein
MAVEETPREASQHRRLEHIQGLLWDIRLLVDEKRDELEEDLEEE